METLKLVGSEAWIGAEYHTLDDDGAWRWTKDTSDLSSQHIGNLHDNLCI